MTYRESNSSLRLLLVLALLLAVGATVVGASTEGGAAPGRVLLPAVNVTTEDVPAIWQQAVLQALTRAAARQNLTLCNPQGRPGCSFEVRDDVPRLVWRVSTSVTIQHSLALIRIPLSLEIRGGDGADGAPEAGLFVVQENLVLPSGLKGAGDRDSFLAHRVREILVGHGPLQEWLASVRMTSDLPTVAPVTAEPVTAAVAEEEGPSRAEVDVWQAEEDAVLGLLIDGRFSEARRAAERLLDDEALPVERRQRVLRLRDEARKRGEAAAAGSAAVAAAPEVESPAEAVPPSPTPRPFDVTVPVRVAPQGQGFLRGDDGRLRIFDDGVRFVPDEAGGGGWFLRWSEIRSWQEASGLWDIDHPLVIATSEGREIHLAQLDREGHITSGKQLLSLLSRGADRASGGR